MPGKNYPWPWPKVRKQVLERDDWRCKIRSPVCTVRATCVDHIVRLEDGGPLFDPMNCRAACVACNRWREHHDEPIPPSRQW